MTIDWGSLPDWISGVTAFFALICAAGAAWAALTQLKYIQDDRKRAQADRIAAWHSAVGTRTSEQGEPSIFFRIFSDVPVYAVSAYVQDLDRGHGAVSVLEVKKPGALPPTARPLTRPLRSTNTSAATLGVGILFRDAGGLYWHRDSVGELHALNNAKEFDLVLEDMRKHKPEVDESSDYKRLP